MVVCSGVSSFNHFIHELSVDSDSDGSGIDYAYGEEDSDEDICPASPSSQSSRVSRSSSIPKHERQWAGWMWIKFLPFLFFWILFPARFLLGLPVRLCRSSYNRCTTTSSAPGSNQLLKRPSLNKVQFLKDHFVQRTTDRRRGVIEVFCVDYSFASFLEFTFMTSSHV